MKKLGILLIVAIALALWATPALADGPDGDVVIWGENYTLGEGEEIRGDLLVYGGNVTLKKDSEVKGAVTVFGGTLTVSGEVDGDVTAWGGDIRIKSEATIRGKVVSVGGSVKREEGADVRGGEVQGWPIPPWPRLPATPELPERPEPPTLPRAPQVRTYRSWGSDIARRISSAFRGVFGIAVMVALGILVVVFIPRHTETVAETMLKAPVQSLFSGLIALVAGSIVLLLLTIIATVLVATICLAPIGLVLFLPLLVAGVAILFGWIAAGLLLGVKVMRALTHKEPNQVIAVAIGILLLSILSMIPCIGWFLALVVAMWSLGAVIYSLFGTRPASGASATSGSASTYDPRMDQK